MNGIIRTAALAALLVAAPASAQEAKRGAFVEARGGVAVPTFDIADVATTGTAVGGTLGLRMGPKWVLMAEFDYGMHEAEASESTDIKTLHYMGKVGYSLTGARDRGWEAAVNLGAGAVTFDIDGAPETYTYFAINAGAKLAYNFNRSVALVLSPQGDIAFGKKDEITTDNAWVWPVTAGIRLNF